MTTNQYTGVIDYSVVYHLGIKNEACVDAIGAID